MQKTNLNVSPYYDDFSEDSLYHRVLFRPAFSVQARELTQMQSILQNQIERMGWDCVGEYKEIESGMKSRDSRPQLRKLLQDSKKRMFDFVMVYSLDRLGRSTVDVINTIHELEEVSVHIFVVKESIDTSTQQGKIFSQFISIFNSMERDMMLTRQKSSIERLRGKDTKWGKGKLMRRNKIQYI